MIIYSEKHALQKSKNYIYTFEGLSRCNQNKKAALALGDLFYIEIFLLVRISGS
jgi:hypothetical protein